MSYLIASVVEIENSDTLHHVKFDCYGHIISMLSLELPKGIVFGKKVKLVVKSLQVAIAKDLSGILSCANQLPMTVHSVDHGEILSHIKLQFFDITIESIIMRTASEKMNLTEDDKVTSLIEASEIAIYEILDD